jgi:hypothetical protein
VVVAEGAYHATPCGGLQCPPASEETLGEAIYIKARLHNCSSVIMAEAAALALGSAICFFLNLTGVNFLSDSQQLVHFFNNSDLANPPDWRNKYFTQSFVNFTSGRCSS